MYRLLLLCAFVSCAYAGTSACCSMEDRQEVLKAWETLWSAEFTGRRVTVAQEVFARLFQNAPETKELFTRVKVEDIKSPEFRAHCVRVTNGLDTMINLAFQTDTLAEQLTHLANQHTKYAGMKASHLTVFREAFAEVLPQAIPCFNVAAWNRCISAMYSKIAAGLA